MCFGVFLNGLVGVDVCKEGQGGALLLLPSSRNPGPCTQNSVIVWIPISSAGWAEAEARSGSIRNTGLSGFLNMYCSQSPIVYYALGIKNLYRDYFKANIYVI